MNILPVDIIKHILLSDIHIINLIQTNKYFLRLGFSKDILCDLINYHIKSYEDGEPIVSSSISSNISSSNDDEDTNKTVYVPSISPIFFASLPSHLLDIPYRIPRCKLNLKNCCVAGGYIVKSIYKLNYCSDIDIWTTKNTNLKSNISYDIIIKDKEPYTCISLSDLSICQQGLVYNKKGRYRLHVTPLSLYTYYTKIILVRFIPLSRRYDSDYSSDGRHIMNTIEYYSDHIKSWFGHYEPFHRCTICIGKWNKEDEVYNHIRKWFKRLSKYEKRFPDYKFVYV